MKKDSFGDETQSQDHEKLSAFSAVAKPLTRREFVLLSGVSAASLLLAGCGGGGGGNGSASRIVLQPNVVILPADGSVTVSNVTSTGMTLSGKIPTIAANTVIVNPAPPGMIRKVTAVTSSSSSQIVLQTAQGTLEEVFQQADLQVSKQFGTSDIAKFVPANGTLSDPNIPKGTPPTGFALSFPAVTLASGVTLSCSGTLNAQLDMSVSIGTSGTPPVSAIQSASFAITLNANLTVTLTAQNGATISSNVQLNNPAWGLAPVSLLTSPAIWITPTITLFTLASGTLKEAMTMTGAIGLSAKGGARYAAGSGWQPITNASLTDTTQPQQLFADIDFTMTPLRAEMDFDLMSVPGPYVHADLPGRELVVSAVPSPTGVEVKLTDSIHADAGCDTSALGASLTNVTLAGLQLVTDTVFDKTYPSQGQATVGIQ